MGDLENIRSYKDLEDYLVYITQYLSTLQTIV